MSSTSSTAARSQSPETLRTAEAESSRAAAAAEAALKRLASPTPKAPNDKEQFAQERETRQKFRRLIDPGILRPNSEKIASTAMQVCVCFAYAC
jgi:hypothetical protein